jgi:hypothetical protein
MQRSRNKKADQLPDWSNQMTHQQRSRDQLLNQQSSAKLFSMMRSSESILHSDDVGDFTLPTLNSIKTLKTLKRIEKLTSAYQQPELQRVANLVGQKRSESRSPIRILDRSVNGSQAP